VRAFGVYFKGFLEGTAMAKPFPRLCSPYKALSQTLAAVFLILPVAAQDCNHNSFDDPIDLAAVHIELPWTYRTTDSGLSADPSGVVVADLNDDDFVDGIDYHQFMNHSAAVC
jgi:hypothetical protein